VLDFQLDRITSRIAVAAAMYRQAGDAQSSGAGFLSWLLAQEEFWPSLRGRLLQVGLGLDIGKVRAALGMNPTVSYDEATEWFHKAGFSRVTSCHLADMLSVSVGRDEGIREAFKAEKPQSIAGRLLGLLRSAPALNNSGPAQILIRMASSESTTPEGFVCGSCLAAAVLGEAVDQMPWKGARTPGRFGGRTGLPGGAVARYKGVTP
jgi:hypothetical protein